MVAPKRARGRQLGALLAKALDEAWLPDRDLDWTTEVSTDAIRTPKELCSIRDLPEYKRMSQRDRRAYRLKETGWALSNLVFGEQRGAMLAAQVIVDSLEERPGDAQFLGIVAAEEARHFQALERYISSKLEGSYPPHPAMIELFRALLTHRLWELKVIVGQILFEPTACSMLCSLLARTDEPLLSEIIRRILRDEARHLAYSYSVAGALVGRLNDATRTEVEDLLFESIVACVTAFLPVAPWKEYGLPLELCRETAVERLSKRGVLEFYSKVIPAQLALHGFPSDRLRDLIAHDLERRLLTVRGTA